jgi:ubiquinone/menaquinone biosynthesis C-methylase UbiE
MGSKEYFDEVANNWDKMRSEFFSEGLREKALKIAEVIKGKVAADIGAGTGFVTEGLLSNGLQVIAVDESEEMLQVMKSKFGDLSNVDFRIGESENLPVEDEGVDYTFANMFLHHVGSPVRAIKEMTRILKPGGKLVITDLDEHNYEFLKTEQNDRWMGFRREDISAWFSEAGLKGVKVECANENCCSTSNCGCTEAKVSIFIAQGKK